MIQVSDDFDLGLDRTRIKDTKDADRQRQTTAVLLQRFFHPDPESRWEVQVLADEVGMGKTFVALGAAYSMLAQMKAAHEEPDLRGCYQKVLIVTPQNSSLFKKWRSEVPEFVRRCVQAELREGADRWFAPVVVERLDDLAREIKKPGNGKRVLVTHMGVLGGGKIVHIELKRRFMLGVLFRYWGTRFKRDARERLLKGAATWPANPDELTMVTADELALLPFSGEDDALTAVERVDRAGEAGGAVERLLEVCKEIAAPYVRGRDEAFQKVEKYLVDIYRHAVFAGVRQALPLVIVDEAHNWKNGPSRNANGFRRFADFIAPRTRRALLLTATPFQLRPDEILEILKVGEYIEPCPTQAESQSRRDHLKKHCEQVIRPVLQHSACQSRRFAKAWSRTPRRVMAGLDAIWSSDRLAQARRELRSIAVLEGVIDEGEMARLIDRAISIYDPNEREILREGLVLYAYNADLSQELGALVVRHRRKTEHRMVRVGSEYAAEAHRCAHRPDKHVLHAAPGIDVRGPGELPHYLLMRCVSEMKSGKGRSSLGSDLTGCYSTLLVSTEGKKVQSALGASPTGKAYLGLLLGMVNADKDAEHPKVKEVLDAIVRNWRAGEKTLVFCFRTHTARRLRELADARIKADLDGRRERVLGGEKSLKALRARFTARENDLIVLGLDRVLWSLIWAGQSADNPIDTITVDELRLGDHEIGHLAELALRYDVDLSAEKQDRVFIHRAHEHIVARRLSGRVRSPLLRMILGEMAAEEWVRSPYGLKSRTHTEDSEEEKEESAEFDERGVHATYEAKVPHPDRGQVETLARSLVDRRERARRQNQIAVLDAYSSAPSFWAGEKPSEHLNAPESDPIVRSLIEMHSQLLGLSRPEKTIDWGTRLLVFQALRRALLRESVLLRLLPERADREEAGWGELIVESFFDTLPGQAESMADRLAVFLEDLRAASGSILEKGSKRHSLYEATRLGSQKFVALVDGNTDPDTRERAFAGFNTPLMPEVLICTTVGQEGIDLHRQCRHVVHYDLAWNPAVLEQRTGRVDRIGSKTFRERATPTGGGSFLDVGVPFLAGTYDERMFEELRMRAQTFEVLTGGDIGAENAEGRDDVDDAEGAEEGLDLPPLPAQMTSDLRVQLHVWEATDG